MALNSKAHAILDKATSSISHETIIAALTQYEVNSRQNTIELPLRAPTHNALSNATGLNAIPQMQYRDVRKSEAFRNLKKRIGELGYDAYDAWVKPGSNRLSVRFAGRADVAPEEVQANVRKLDLFLKKAFESVSEAELIEADKRIAKSSITSLQIPLKASELIEIDSALGFGSKIPAFSENFIWANEGYQAFDRTIRARGKVILDTCQNNDRRSLNIIIEPDFGLPSQHGWFR